MVLFSVPETLKEGKPRFVPGITRNCCGSSGSLARARNARGGESDGSPFLNGTNEPPKGPDN